MVELWTITVDALAPMPYVLLPVTASVTVRLTAAPLAKIPTPLPKAVTRVSTPLRVPVPPDETRMPLLRLLATVVSETSKEADPPGAKAMPEFAKPRTTDFWIFRAPPELNWIPVP